MDVRTFEAACMAKPGVSASYPFGPEAHVFKVLDKMFALVAVDSAPLRVSLKCDPERALILRETYPAIQPGYHLNKRHWNTLTLDESLSDELVLQLVAHSYELVVKSLKKAEREQLSAR
ncbi:MmcQ/YjbR family DNA-binding protein [bacterium]|nr:MmcQ/YjbR family DNA-binding protein [bacterium]